MGTSQLAIYNKALALARARNRLMSITDAGESAYQCNLWYDTVRRTALNAAHWNFARAVVPLVVDKTAFSTADFNNDFNLDFGTGNLAPPFPWYYSFSLPSNFLRVLYVLDQSSYGGGVDPGYGSGFYSMAVGPEAASVRFAIFLDSNENQPVIVTNQLNCTVVVILDLLDPTLWDVQFENAVTFGLAGYLAEALTGDDALVKRRIQTANQILMEAQVSNLNEQSNQVPDWTPSWLTARGCYSPIRDFSYSSFGPLFSL